MRIVRGMLLLLLAGALGACASVPRQKPYDPSVRTKVKTIGILTPALTEEVSVRMFVHPVESLGVIGKLIAEGEMSGKSSEFTAAMSARGFETRKQFRDDLVEGLTEAGYEVRFIETSRPISTFGFASRYPIADGSVDAYLDLYSGLIGYTAAGISSPYRPTIYLGARLVRANDLKVLYQDAIAYNAFGDPRDMVTITPASGYEFSAFDDLMAKQAHAAEGLSVALKATGQELARQLR